jgi:dolichol-phosphate mannosyltransferase
MAHPVVARRQHVDELPADLCQLGAKIATTSNSWSVAPEGPELTVVVPTFNETENVQELVRLLNDALCNVNWEVIFVDDDSEDGTADRVRSITRADRRVRCVQRLGRRGLSSACVEGILGSSAPFVAIMDGDLQHDERILLEMLAKLRSGKFDVVIGSRYIEGGSVGEWQSHRAFMSKFATALARVTVRADVKDPMSGFFMIRRESFMGVVRNLSSTGFKILLDIFASSRVRLSFCEIPYTFRTRKAGESKLDSTVMWEYMMLLLDKVVGRYVPIRFLSFSIIGGVGALIHMSALAAAFKLLGAGFATAQAGATVIAMTTNFFMNNALTYRDRRLKGWKIMYGLITFYAVCGLGAVSNVGIATVIFEQKYSWWLAASAGILIGATWNYAATSLFTWQHKQ